MMPKGGGRVVQLIQHFEKERAFQLLGNKMNNYWLQFVYGTKTSKRVSNKK